MATWLDEERLRLPAEPVHGTFVRPRASRGVAVVVISGSGGGDALSTGMARALAVAGFPALGLGYFKVPGRPDELRDVPLEYFEDAVGVVRARCGDGVPVVLLGSSRGSEAALLVASRSPGLVDGLIGLVPANAAFGSWPPGGAAWTADGEAVPSNDEIPVERIEGAVLLVSAGRDEVWPSSSMASALVARLERHGRPCVHLTYPEATHALSYIAPVTKGDVLPADAAARDDAWPRIVEFLGSV